MTQTAQRRTAAIIVLAIIFCCAFRVVRSICFSPREDSAANSVLSVIDQKKAKGIVYFLASDELRGRKFGTQEGKKAARFIYERMSATFNDVRHSRVFQQKFCLQMTLERIVCGQNVIAFLEGSSNKTEYVFVTAHYDHLGEENEQTYPGADDNASGTAGVMEVATAFAALAKNNLRPARNVVFAFFDGEEEGLLGSQYFVDHSSLPSEAITAVINLDMVGRNGEQELNFVASPDVLDAPIKNPDLYRISQRAAAKTGLKLLLTEENRDDESFWRSDHASFFYLSQENHRIPVIYCQDGDHPDYHQPSDTADKISYAKIERVAKFAFLVAYDVANASRRPAYYGD